MTVDKNSPAPPRKTTANPYRSAGGETTPRRAPRRPVPTIMPGGSETVNAWLLEWAAERRELEQAEDALAAEREARRRAEAHAEERNAECNRLQRYLNLAAEERDTARAELEATRRTLTATIAAHEETMRERDQARGEVADLLAHADADAHYATRAARAEAALATVTAAARDLMHAWDEEPPTREAVMPEIRRLRDALALSPPPRPDLAGDAGRGACICEGVLHRYGDRGCKHRRDALPAPPPRETAGEKEGE